MARIEGNGVVDVSVEVERKALRLVDGIVDEGMLLNDLLRVSRGRYVGSN